jgi:galactose mutarotase-like enzyme
MMVTISRNADCQTYRLESDLLAVTVNPERGADVLSVIWRPTETEVLWQNPRSRGLPPVRGDYDTDPRSYFDNYPGGMQELFPNAGPATEVEGATLPFHGEALRRPWTVEQTESTLTCTTVLTRYPFALTKTFRLDGGVLHVSARVENISDTELPVHWGFHPAFNTQTIAGSGQVYGAFAALTSHPEKFSSSQLHAPGARIDASPVDGVGVFNLAPAGSRSADLLYATVSEGWFGLKSPGSDLLVTMSWPAEILPELWIWEEAHAPGGYPWWGTAHIVAVEPHTTSPFGPLESEHGAIKISGGDTLQIELTLGVQPISQKEIPIGMDATGVAQLGVKT